MKKLIFSTIFVVLIITAMGGCSTEVEPEPIEFTVTHDLSGLNLLVDAIDSPHLEFAWLRSYQEDLGVIVLAGDEADGVRMDDATLGRLLWTKQEETGITVGVVMSYEIATNSTVVDIIKERAVAFFAGPDMLQPEARSFLGSLQVDSEAQSAALVVGYIGIRAGFVHYMFYLAQEIPNSDYLLLLTLVLIPMQIAPETLEALIEFDILHLGVDLQNYIDPRYSRSNYHEFFGDE